MVQRDSRGEGEQTEWRGGSGVALNSRPVAHGGRGARVATATAREARREGVRLSTAFVGVVQVGEEKRARSEARACEHAHWSSRAAGARAKGGSRREKEEGARGVACCGCRGVSTSVRGRTEVVGGRSVNGRERDDVLQSASLAGIRGFSARTHAPTFVW